MSGLLDDRRKRHDPDGREAHDADIPIFCASLCGKSVKLWISNVNEKRAQTDSFIDPVQQAASELQATLRELRELVRRKFDSQPLSHNTAILDILFHHKHDSVGIRENEQSILRHKDPRTRPDLDPVLSAAIRVTAGANHELG